MEPTDGNKLCARRRARYAHGLSPECLPNVLMRFCHETRAQRQRRDSSISFRKLFVTHKSGGVSLDSDLYSLQVPAIKSLGRCLGSVSLRPYITWDLVKVQIRNP